MNTEQLIQVINATANSAGSLLNQVAWFMAVGQAASWLAYSFPLLVMFSVIMRIKKNQDEDTTKGGLALVGWTILCITVFTATKGIAHLIQAGMAPSIYVADQIGILTALLSTIQTK